MSTQICIDAIYGGKPRSLGPRAVPSSIVKSALPGPWTVTESRSVESWTSRLTGDDA